MGGWVDGWPKAIELTNGVPLTSTPCHIDSPIAGPQVFQDSGALSGVNVSEKCGPKFSARCSLPAILYLVTILYPVSSKLNERLVIAYSKNNGTCCALLRLLVLSAHCLTPNAQRPMRDPGFLCSDSLVLADF